MASYRMTPARRRALRKAQLASARKRRGKGKGKLAAANRRITRYKRARNALITAAAVGGAATLAYSKTSTGRRHRAAIGEARLQQSYRPFESKRGFVSYARYSNRQFKSVRLQNKAAIHGSKAIHARRFTRVKYNDKHNPGLSDRFARQAMYHTKQSVRYSNRAKKLRSY